MGLDTVEIVLRAEEVFGISIGDDEAGRVLTVGDLYRLVCSKVSVVPLESPVTSEMLPVLTRWEPRFRFLKTSHPLPAPKELLPWSPQGVWDCIVAIFVDQIHLEADEVKYSARIHQDLGID